MKSSIFLAISFIYLNTYSIVEGEATSKPSSETSNKFTGKTSLSFLFTCVHQILYGVYCLFFLHENLIIFQYNLQKALKQIDYVAMNNLR